MTHKLGGDFEGGYLGPLPDERAILDKDGVIAAEAAFGKAEAEWLRLGPIHGPDRLEPALIAYVRVSQTKARPATSDKELYLNQVFEIAEHAIKVAAPGLSENLRRHSARTIAMRVAALAGPDVVRVETYSRPECRFAYCPHGEICKDRDACALQKLAPDCFSVTVRFNDDGEFGAVTGWLYLDGNVWRPIERLRATTDSPNG